MSLKDWCIVDCVGPGAFCCPKLFFLIGAILVGLGVFVIVVWSIVKKITKGGGKIKKNSYGCGKLYLEKPFEIEVECTQSYLCPECGEKTTKEGGEE